MFIVVATNPACSGGPECYITFLGWRWAPQAPGNGSQSPAALEIGGAINTPSAAAAVTTFLAAGTWVGKGRKVPALRTNRIGKHHNMPRHEEPQLLPWRFLERGCVAWRKDFGSVRIHDSQHYSPTIISCCSERYKSPDVLCVWIPFHYLTTYASDPI